MEGLIGLLLAGGMASRFGSDKSLFKPYGGDDMLGMGLSLLAGVPEITLRAVACRCDQASAMRRRLPKGIALVVDQPHEKASPILGITAAPRKWRGALLVLTCDLPLMSADVLRDLCVARAAALARSAPPLRTAFCHADGRVETLVSIWEPECLGYLEHALERGRLGAYSAIPAERQVLVPVRDARPFFNLNTPEDALRLGTLTGQRPVSRV